MAEEDNKPEDITQNMKEEKTGIDKQEHREQIKKEFDEAKYEKKKIFGFQKNLLKKFDFRKSAMFKGKFTHGTKGKPTHGPRGNQG